MELAPNDPELRRAWKHFPWVHIFVHELHPTEYRTVYARVPARPGWAP